MTLDHARHFAAEGGYLGADTEEAMRETTINDLLEALDHHPIYAARDDEIAFNWLMRGFVQDERREAREKICLERDLAEIPF